MRLSFLLAAFGLTILFLSCDPTTYLGPQFNGAKPENLRLSYHQGVCFGSCPVYTLDVYKNGLFVYRGERFTDRPGVWHKNVDRRVVASFLDSLDRIDFSAYPRSFPSRLPDAPTVTITHYDGLGEPTVVSFEEETSPELRRLAERLQQFANQAGYRQVSETLADGKVATAKGQREELIVHLNKGADAGAWVVKYGKQDVRLGRRVTPNGDYYIVTANPNVMAADELLTYLRTDPEVVSAQLNGQVSPR